MELKDYPRPERDNGRGLHWSATPYHPTELDEWMARLRAMNIRWLKVLDDSGGSSLRICTRLLSEGIMPVVRLYRQTPNPGHIGGSEEKTIRDLVKLGVRYIETNNEPDLQVEWAVPRPQDWLSIVAENWLFDAGKCLDAGALPAVPALGVGRKDNLLQAIVEKGGKDALMSGAWIAIHNYALNHPLDYPDDDVNQRGVALTQAGYDADGTWAWDNMPLDTINTWRWQDKNTGDTIIQDQSCFRAFEFVNSQAQQVLGVSLPMISTEGGVVMGWRDDRRYPRVTPRIHMERTVAMHDYMQTTAPPYYFAVCSWLIANFMLGHMNTGWESQSWYTDWWNPQFSLQGRLPTVDAVIAMPSLTRLEMQGPHHSVVEGDVVAMRGVGGLRVRLEGEAYSAAMPTDADGRFRFFGLAPGIYTLQAGGLIKAGLQLDGTNTETLAGLRPPAPATPELDWDRRLSDIKVTMTPAEVAPGATLWKLVGAQLLDRTQAGTGGGVYYDVLDEVGRPMAGQEVVLGWPTGMGRKSTEQREAPAHCAEFPIAEAFNPTTGPGPYSAWVDGLPCDRVTGLGLPLGQAVGFVLVFQRATKAGPSGSTIEGTITGDSGLSVTLYKPDGQTATTKADANGHYAIAGLPPGAYDLEIAGQGKVGRGLDLDGTNTIVFDYTLPGHGSILRGSIVNGEPGLDVILRSSSGEVRHTTVNEKGQFEFRVLDAGTYSVTVGGQTVSGMVLDGIKALTLPPIDVRPSRSVIAGHVRSKGGKPVAKLGVILSGPRDADAAPRQAVTDDSGAYEFAQLAPGTYTVQAAEASQAVRVDGISKASVDLVVTVADEEKVIALAVLMGPPAAMGTEANLRLAQRYIRAFAPTITFRVEEAQRAKQVLIIGDVQGVNAADEDRLRAAGCAVVRLGGTPYAVEDALDRLIAGGSPMPKGRSAAALPRRKAEQ